MGNVAKHTVAYAHKKVYSSRFNREHYKTVSVMVNKTKEKDILDKLTAQPQMGVYIKRLIREDIERSE